MPAHRRAAVWIGVLYIIGTVVLVLSGLVTNTALAGPAYMAQIAAQPNQVAVGALLLLLGGFALTLVPVVFWPVGKHNETVAARAALAVHLGLLGAVLYILAPLGSMFELSLGIFLVPLALQEMVMAVWLIAKGFDPSARLAEPAGRTSLPRAAASGSAA